MSSLPAFREAILQIDGAALIAQNEQKITITLTIDKETIRNHSNLLRALLEHAEVSPSLAPPLAPHWADFLNDGPPRLMGWSLLLTLTLVELSDWVVRLYP